MTSFHGPDGHHALEVQAQQVAKGEVHGVSEILGLKDL